MLKIYVSYKDVEEAIPIAKLLMDHGYLPFIPRLNKLITGRSDEEWVRYYASWLYSCDVIWVTPSAREHEIAVAKNFGMPIVKSLTELTEVTLPPYRELCQEFSKLLATHLAGSDPKEEWRGEPAVGPIEEFEKVVGRGSSDKTFQKDRALNVAAKALKVWDITH